MSELLTDAGGLIPSSVKHLFFAAIIGLMSQNRKMLRGLNGYVLQIRDATNELVFD